MTPTWILAVDPGLTVGWSSAHLESPLDAHAGQMPADPFCDWLEALPAGEGLVCLEKFTITPQTAKKSLVGSYVTLDVIGAVKHIARRKRWQIDYTKGPSEAKNFCSDAQLKKLGLWKPGQDHARDALRHLVLGIVSHGSGQVRDELIQCLA